MTSVGLVLSAGGSTGDPWHAGVLAALAEQSGWDARSADLVVGTSAGAITAVGLRAGLSPVDRHAHHRGDPVSAEARAILDRIVTPWAEERTDRSVVPQSLPLTVRAVWPPWRIRPVHAAVGLIPAGTLSGERLQQRMDELHPAEWPAAPTWITSVRLDDGTRVVFGRDEAAVSVGQAVRASCSVPGIYEPAPIAGGRYIDGGVESSTNADLMAPLAFDLVIISSCMTGVPAAVGLAAGRPTRTWMARRLAGEVAAIRATGTAVLVVQPTQAALGLLDGDDPSGAAVTEMAATVTRDRLALRDGRGVVALLSRAAA